MSSQNIIMKLTPRLLGRFVNSRIITKVRDGTNYMFKNHLLLVNVGISATLSGVGDSLQQHYEKYKTPERKYDYRRTFNMGVTGVTIGVLCHYWYIWLDKFLPGATFRIAMKKMLIDQIVCSPATITTFFITLGILEGSSIDEVLQEFRCKSFRLYLAEWVIWPPAQFINFFWLPLRYRVLWDNTVSTCYDVYTSYVKHEVPADCEASKPDEDVNTEKTKELVPPDPSQLSKPLSSPSL